MDYMIRATAGKYIRAFCATTRDLTEYARKAHNTSPVMTAALGRLLCAGVLMGSTMKNPEDIMTLKIEGDGPGRGLCVTADSLGHVKGYPYVAEVILPANDKGKLDVAGAMGIGVLSVIKDIGLKEPYIGQTILVSGEIAEDLTYYYATSEQTPTSIALGVLMNRDNTVRCAGGMMIQLMPDAPEEIISTLEERLKKLPPMTTMLDQGMEPEDILSDLLDDIDPDGWMEITDRMDCSFVCECSKQRVEKALISIGKSELQEMIDDGKPIEVKCHFCNTAYTFSVEELEALKARR